MSVYSTLSSQTGNKKKETMRKTHLTIRDVHWPRPVILDHNVAAFFHEGRYYRAVLPGAAPLFAHETLQPLLDGLAAKGFIPPTERCDLTVEGLGPVYVQHTEYFSVHGMDYCPEMLREAARLYCKLNLELLKRGFMLVDGHDNNFVVQGASKPKWCDIGSIIPCPGPQSLTGVDEFVRRIVYPLLLRAKSPHFADIVSGAIQRKRGLSHEAAVELGIFPQFLKNTATREQLLQALLDLVESTAFTYLRTAWSDYHDGKGHGEAEGSNRFRLFKRITSTLAPKTAIDFGANAGVYSRELADRGAEVLAVEPDETAVAKHFALLRETGYDKIVKLKRGGVSLHELEKPAELVLALALTHHLYLSQGWSWKNLARIFAEQSLDALLTEFMPNGLGGREKPAFLPEDYRIDRFAAQLERYFESVEILEYDPGDRGPRTFLLCRGKREIPVDDGFGKLPLTVTVS